MDSLGKTPSLIFWEWWLETISYTKIYENTSHNYLNHMNNSNKQFYILWSTIFKHTDFNTYMHSNNQSSIISHIILCADLYDSSSNSPCQVSIHLVAITSPCAQACNKIDYPFPISNKWENKWKIENKIFYPFPMFGMQASF